MTQLDVVQSMDAEEIAGMLVSGCIVRSPQSSNSLAYTSPADDYSIAYASRDMALRKTVEWLNSEVHDEKYLLASNTPYRRPSKQVPTCNLVEELKTRPGVTSYQVNAYAPFDFHITGPAILLVVED